MFTSKSVPATLSPARVEREAVVRVEAPARLHFGFLDPSGSLGRRFGSVGLVIDGFDAAVEIVPGHRNAVVAVGDGTATEIERASQLLDRLRTHTGLTAPLVLRLLKTAPAHAGFGSGTQLALAIGRAFVRWHGLDVPTPQLAGWLGRGLRSGIGIAGFDLGGLIVDGGPSADGTPAAPLSRLALPAAWRVLIVRDPRRDGLHGAPERAALAALPPLPRAQAADLCHQVLMRVLPGAAHGDFAAFAGGLSRMQAVLGGHFAPAQEGRAYSSAEVEALMTWLQREAGEGGAAIGQSSWGPTGFAVLPSAARAQALLDGAAQAGVLHPALRCELVTARGHGARIGGAPVAAAA